MGKTFQSLSDLRPKVTRRISYTVTLDTDVCDQELIQAGSVWLATTLKDKKLSRSALQTFLLPFSESDTNQVTLTVSDRAMTSLRRHLNAQASEMEEIYPEEMLQSPESSYPAIQEMMKLIGLITGLKDRTRRSRR